MRALFITVLLMLNISSHARGMVVQCWEEGVSQKDENLVYQYDGDYIHKSFIMFDGVREEIVSNRSRCTWWDELNICTDTIFRKNGDEITVKLKKAMEFKDGSEGFYGNIYGIEITPVFCKRTAL